AGRNGTQAVPYNARPPWCAGASAGQDELDGPGGGQEARPAVAELEQEGAARDVGQLLDAEAAVGGGPHQLAGGELEGDRVAALLDGQQRAVGEPLEGVEERADGALDDDGLAAGAGAAEHLRHAAAHVGVVLGDTVAGDVVEDVLLEDAV